MSDDEDQDDSPDLDRGFRPEDDDDEDDINDDYVDDYEQFGEEAKSPLNERKMISVVTSSKPQQD